VSHRVLVAHDSEPIRGVIGALLVGAGYAVRAVADGATCRLALADAPSALVLDVGLSDVLAFELIEEARKRAPGLRVILVASVYNRTSYKRRPTTLYGADDYVEQHHIADSLVNKLGALLEGKTPAVTPPGEVAEDETVRRAGTARFDAPIDSNEPDGEALLRAERLARLIVADIALYNGDAVAAARLGKGLESLEARLRADLEEGRLLFDLRVPATVRASRDFIGDALAELLREGSR
jgi:DNA-binding response OmpR family regulator